MWPYRGGWWLLYNTEVSIVKEERKSTLPHKTPALHYGHLLSQKEVRDLHKVTNRVCIWLPYVLLLKPGTSGYNTNSVTSGEGLLSP